jgi:hypothetical protein
VVTAALSSQLKATNATTDVEPWLRAADPTTWPEGMASFGARWENAARIPSLTCEVVGTVDGGRYTLLRVPASLNTVGAAAGGRRGGADALTSEMVTGKNWTVWVDSAGIADAAAVEAAATAEAAEPVVAATHAVPVPQAAPAPAAGAGSGGAWGCPTCTFRNPAARASCEMCETPRP